MKIQNIFFYPYEMPLNQGKIRKGAFVKILAEKQQESWGEIAPLPGRSCESLQEALEQLKQIKPTILNQNWDAFTYLETLENFNLYPSILFALESALSALLNPLLEHNVLTSAFFTGSTTQILNQAEQKHHEGYTSAKVKVSQLSLKEAFEVIQKLKDRFYLRIDVNRAWKTKEALSFFSEFPFDAFDYVEEPFENPHDLIHFSHPLAIDESFPLNLSLQDLEKLPTLKALIYKPTIQGGLYKALCLKKWTDAKKLNLILSSSFESDLGLIHIASLAHRLSIKSPIGIGTHTELLHSSLEFSGPLLNIKENPAHEFLKKLIATYL